MAVVDATLLVEQADATLAALKADAARALTVADETARARLQTVVDRLSAALTVTGTVALDAASLAALESVTAAVTGTVDLSAATLAALESISVANLPATYPLPADQVTALAPLATQPVSGPLTDAQLRAARVPVDVAGIVDATLTSRMLAKQPAPGYELWMDTTQTDYVYLLEAPAGSLETAAVFRGVRLPKGPGGAGVLGRLPERSGFTWAARLDAGTWA